MWNRSGGVVGPRHVFYITPGIPHTRRPVSGTYPSIDRTKCSSYRLLSPPPSAQLVTTPLSFFRLCRHCCCFCFLIPFTFSHFRESHLVGVDLGPLQRQTSCQWLSSLNPILIFFRFFEQRGENSGMFYRCRDNLSRAFIGGFMKGAQLSEGDRVLLVRHFRVPILKRTSTICRKVSNK